MINAVIGLVGTLIDKAVPNKEQAAKLKSRITEAAMNLSSQELKAQSSIIVAEAGGDSWLQRNWRPVTMLTFTALVVAHWLGYTADNLREEEIVMLLEIVKVGLGGYVIGRSVEKSVKAYVDKK